MRQGPSLCWAEPAEGNVAYDVLVDLILVLIDDVPATENQKHWGSGILQKLITRVARDVGGKCKDDNGQNGEDGLGIGR